MTWIFELSVPIVKWDWSAFVHPSQHFPNQSTGTLYRVKTKLIQVGFAFLSREEDVEGVACILRLADNMRKRINSTPLVSRGHAEYVILCMISNPSSNVS